MVYLVYYQSSDTELGSALNLFIDNTENGNAASACLNKDPPNNWQLQAVKVERLQLTDR